MLPPAPVTRITSSEEELLSDAWSGLAKSVGKT